jgi:multidrug resistance efflux pump
VEQVEQIGLLIGSVLDIRCREERSLARRAWDAITTFFSRLVGPSHLRLKAATSLALVVLIFLALASDKFRIVSDAVLEPTVLRAIVAPQNGYIAEANVRAGDIVKRGDLLLTLDDKDLLLEQRKFLGQSEQYRKEYRSALAGYDRVQVAINKARIQQAEAQLSLVDTQLVRTKLIAPIDGLVVSGDLSQSLGSPVERGEVLFEVAPLESYRAILKVDERDIGYIKAGQQGRLTLAGMPAKPISLKVEKITPVTISEEGRNYFRIEAVMDLQSDLLHPGMEGVAKIEVGSRKLIWIWSRRLVDWLRLWTWAKLP